MSFYYKIHESHAGYLLAACDKSVCGKTLKDGKIEFLVNPRFYKDKEATKTKMRELFIMSSSANIVGKNIVQLAIDLGAIDKENIKTIKGIPHAQIVVMSI
jgi:uncharacterized protein